MKETIYTIPITEAFERRCGCPICTLYADLEEKSVDYIVGAAMMEPDVRIKTNEQGFCAAHYRMMLEKKNRLSLALMLESHIKSLQTMVDDVLRRGDEPDARRAASLLTRPADSCFVCARIDEYMVHYYENIFHMWAGEDAFRDLFKSQPYFCLPHASALLTQGARGLHRRHYRGFAGELLRLEKDALTKLSDGVSTFCKSFDYRFADMELGEAKLSVECAISLLSGDAPDVPRPGDTGHTGSTPK